MVKFINYLVSASLVSIVVVLFVIVSLRLKDPILTSLTPKPPEAAKPMVDTDIQAWVPYDNATHNVSFNVPAGWNIQDYSVFINNGGGFVAFSPRQLPCSTCSYLNDGYFSLRIFNQQTDPSLYALFAERVKKSQEDPTGFKNIKLDEKTGLVYQNTAAVENDGWIYEISLDENGGVDPIENNPIMKQIFTSWKFTKLFH